MELIVIATLALRAVRLRVTLASALLTLWRTSHKSAPFDRSERQDVR